MNRLEKPAWALNNTPKNASATHRRMNGDSRFSINLLSPVRLHRRPRARQRKEQRSLTFRFVIESLRILAGRIARTLRLHTIGTSRVGLVEVENFPMRATSKFFFWAKVVYFEENHSTRQRGMLHTAVEGGTATEGDRGGGGVLGRVTWGLFARASTFMYTLHFTSDVHFSHLSQSTHSM